VTSVVSLEVATSDLLLFKVPSSNEEFQLKSAIQSISKLCVKWFEIDKYTYKYLVREKFKGCVNILDKFSQVRNL